MSEKYLGEVSTPLLINQIKDNCTQKRTTLPIASIDELGHIYQYMGATSGNLVHGYFYECVSDGQDPANYSWSQVNVQPTAGTPTAATTTYDNTTSGLSATNVQNAIDEVEGRVDTVENKIPSTATSSNKLIDHDSLGTAAFKDSTDRVSPNNTALVESQSVYSAINTALSSIYTPRGDITCAELTSDLLIAANVGNIYETSDSGTTTALFLQGAGVPIATGSNVGIISAGQGRILFNLMANAFDLTGYQKKDLTQAVEGATTVEGALGALSTNKADKVASATNGDIASLDANGNLVDSGMKKTEVNALIPKRTALNNTTTNMWAVFSTSQLGQNYLVSTYFGGYCSTIILERFNSYIIRSSDTNSQPQLQVQEVTWSADGTKFALNIPYASPNISFTPIGGNSIVEQPTYIGSMTEANMLSELGLTSYTNYLQKLATKSDWDSVSRVYEYTSSNVPTKAEFLSLLTSTTASISFKFKQVTTDYLPSVDTYWYVFKIGGKDSRHVKLIASAWNSAVLYTSLVNADTSTITWEKVVTESDITPTQIASYTKAGGGAFNLKVYKSGGMKYINITGDSTAQALTNGELYTLTDTAVPTIAVTFPCYYVQVGASSKVGFIFIGTNGKVQLRDAEYELVTANVTYIRGQGWYY